MFCQVFTQWTEWGECNTCGTMGIRQRFGTCMVKKISMAAPIGPRDIPIMTMYQDGVPCRSTVLTRPVAHLNGIRDRKSEIITGMKIDRKAKFKYFTFFKLSTHIGLNLCSTLQIFTVKRIFFFQTKIVTYFLIFAKNIDYEYSLEPPNQNMKKNVCPCNPQVYCIKMGSDGV